MLSPKSHAFINSSYANLDLHRKVQKEPMLLIHPEDAGERGIETGMTVRVFNDRGAFTVLAKVDSSTMPGVTVSSMGHWRKNTISLATPASLNPTAFADLGNAPTFSDTLVEVEVVDT